ncbi:unnamed protein product [Lota lota]
MMKAKRVLAVQRLRQLRATNPTVAMVSTLDLQHRRREGGRDRGKEAAASNHDDQPGPSSVANAAPQRSPAVVPLMPPPPCPSTPSPLRYYQSPLRFYQPQSTAKEYVEVPITPSESPKRVTIMLSPTGSRDETPVACMGCVQLTKRVEELERFVRDLKESGLINKGASSSRPAVFQSPSPRKKYQHTARTPQLKVTAIENPLSAAHQSTFMDKAKIAIPKLLTALRQCSTPSDLEMVYGYISGYLAIVSGHRPVVFTSLKIADVREAERKGDRYVLWVGEHKTQRSFGHAQMPLYKEEIQWLKELAVIVSSLVEDAVWLFVRRDGKAVQKLNRHLTSAWADAGLKGEINFNMVRSSVSTQCKKHLSVEDRTLVATSMCHDVATADKFYCPVADLEDAFKSRQLRMKALVEGLDNSAAESTEEEEVPVYNDTPDSSSPPTPCSDSQPTPAATMPSHESGEAAEEEEELEKMEEVVIMDEARPSCSSHLDIGDDMKKSGGGQAVQVRRAQRKRRQLSSSESDVEDASQPLPHFHLALPLADSSDEDEVKMTTKDKPTVVRNLNFQEEEEVRQLRLRMCGQKAVRIARDKLPPS